MRIIGGFESQEQKCLEGVPADIEIKDDKSSLDICPHKPIPTNKDSEAIVLKVINAKRFEGYINFTLLDSQQVESVSTYLEAGLK